MYFVRSVVMKAYVRAKASAAKSIRKESDAKNVLMRKPLFKLSFKGL